MNAPLFTLNFAHAIIRVTPLFLLGVVASLVLALNAILMIIAPTYRDSLPRLLRAPGALLPDRHNSGETRVAGLLVLGMLSWVVYDMLNRTH